MSGVLPRICFSRPASSPTRRSTGRHAPTITTSLFVVGRMLEISREPGRHRAGWATRPMFFRRGSKTSRFEPLPGAIPLGHFVEAEQAITRIQGRSERAHALADLAEAEGLTGQHARATERLKQALDLVEKNSAVASRLALAAIANIGFP